MLHAAINISRKTGIAYNGPRILSQIALVTEDPGERKRALDEGEAILKSGAVGHNYFWYYRDVMEIALKFEDWTAAESNAQALEDFTRAEPLPWSEFFIARGRALAAFGRGGRDAATIDALRRLRDEAKRIGWNTALPALDEALKAA